MNELQVFNNPEFGQIRTVTIENEPWFVGKDVAAALGYSNPRDAIQKHVDDEDKGASRIATPSGTQETTVINESGLYSLIMSSKLPTAKKFKRWVTSEVLPTLRKTGQYSLVPVPAAQRVLTTDDYLKAATVVAACRNERLPYVLHYLTEGGFEPPRISATPIADNSVKAVRLMREAKIKGLNNSQIGQITGLDRVQVSRYVNGQTLPRGNRATFLVEVLGNALDTL